MVPVQTTLDGMEHLEAVKFTTVPGSLHANETVTETLIVLCWSLSRLPNKLIQRQVSQQLVEYRKLRSPDSHFHCSRHSTPSSQVHKVCHTHA